MNVTPVERKGVEDTLNGFDLFQTPFFAVFHTKRMLFCFVDDDNEAARAFLIQQLQALEASGNTAVYTLKVYDEPTKKGQINESVPCCGSLCFRITDPMAGLIMNTNTGKGQHPVQHVDRYTLFLEQQLRTHQEETQLLRQEVEALKEITIEGKEEENNLGWIGDVAAAAEKYPKFADTVMDLLTMAKSFLSKQFPMSNQNNTQQAPGGAISGVRPGLNPDDTFREAMNILYKVNPNMTDDLVLLANMAANDPDMFQIALKKLRALA